MKIVSNYLFITAMFCMATGVSFSQDVSMVVPNYEFVGEVSDLNLSEKAGESLESFSVGNVQVSCVNGDFRITNITNIKSELYMGGLCNAANKGTKEDLVLYVLKVRNVGTEHKGDIVASFPLNYDQNQSQNGEWLPWAFDTEKRQPVLLFIYYDSMKKMALGVTDRKWAKKMVEEEDDIIRDFTSSDLDGIDVIYWDPFTKQNRLANAWEKERTMKEFMQRSELKVLEEGTVNK
ncbi:hypothetical protein [Arcticibacterium luteifluviistationis]|uniref:Uncharacterized protein n=1 Tax=Arcticibacterium luteifluviistationis TaxID=1784714 RepID=A0A2Z4GH99_9BACT|nr:hypothetical protein [Arcticibacterium luteifluviistationis]AWW00691.1 hypothetical protein DJ013_21880 [Arcticibacterium luteifluviistationis]